MRKTQLHRTRTFIYITLFLWVLIMLYVLFQTPAPALGMLRRATALFGYSSLFLSIISSEYMREMRKLFGKPFLTVHHILAVVGLMLTAIHPLTFALENKDLSVFVPVFSPVSSFLAWAGRPALYLIFLAALAAMARGHMKSIWRSIHWLNYLAFILAFVHAWHIGTDVATGLLRLAWAVMAVLVLVVFAQKRLR